MQHFYPHEYSQEYLDRQQAEGQRQSDDHSPSALTGVVPGSGTANEGLMNTMVPGYIPEGAEDYADIVMQDSRRQSIPQAQRMQPQFGGNIYNQPMVGQSMEGRRASMLDFAGGQGALGNFQFGNGTQQPAQLPQDQSRGQSIDLTSQFAAMAASMGIPTGQPFPMPHGSGPVNTSAAFDISGAIPATMNVELMGNMGGMMGFGGMDLAAMQSAQTSMGMFDPNFPHQFGGQAVGTIAQDFPMTMVTAPPQLRAMGSHSSNSPHDLQQPTSSSTNERPSLSASHSDQSMYSPTTGMPMFMGNQHYQTPPNQPSMHSHALPVHGPPRPPPKKSAWHGAYSSSGFDLMKALRKVDERKNPEIDIGPVDLTCAFVICDVTLDDCEIVFVSDVFEMLTGYNKHEIIGQNCRFLQSPTGQVEKRSKRLYVDNDTVYDLRRRIERRREVQRSLINYRKGGQAFTNLLTMIPIPWDTDAIRYFVGFQVDLVDKPSAIGNKNPVTNTYSVNYKHTPFPRYILHPLDAARIQAGTGQTISKLEVSSILQAYSNSGDPEYIARMWDRLLLENCDDVVHVLSLKGLFQYLSPSCKKVLEYQPSELSGLPLSTICHPSDIVPVMRELKDATPDAPVSLVFRIRRKNSGYTWFESHGSLCLEQGKGRKCIILVGRERPVYALSREEIRKAGWIGENEFWSKISTSGMFLFVTGNVKTLLLDRLPAELVGTSMQALMKTESRREFGKALNIARTGLVASFKHEMINKRGQSLMAETTLYPGDSSKGMKPTFLLAQTRILKPPARGQGGSGRGSSSSARQGTSGSENSTQIVQYSPSGDPGDSTPRSSNSGGPHLISQPGGSGLPYGSQDEALASELNLFEELKTTRCTSWQFELRQMEKSNRVLLQEVASLQANKKKRKRSRNGARGNIVRLCANCGVSETPEWRKGPTGERDYCNACGLRYEKIVKQKAQEARRAAGLTTETATSSGSGGSATGAPAASGGEGARGGKTSPPNRRPESEASATSTDNVPAKRQQIISPKGEGRGKGKGRAAD